MTNIELYNTIEQAQRILVENWGYQGKVVIALAFQEKKFDGDMKTFLIGMLFPMIWEFSLLIVFAVF